MSQSIIDSSAYIDERAGETFIRYTQEVTDDLLADLKSMRAAQDAMRTRDMHLACSVPVAVYNIWIRQGLDPWRMSAREKVALLRKEGLDAFVTTSRNV